MADPTVPPDLASILATLAQFAPQQQNTQQTPPPTATTPTITDPRLQRRQNNQSSLQPFAQIPNHLQQNNPEPSNSYNPQAAVFQPVVPQGRAFTQPLRTSTPQQQEQTIIDPATITEWTAGLRCVTKIAAQSPQFAEKIRGFPIQRLAVPTSTILCTMSITLVNLALNSHTHPSKTIGSTNTPLTPQTPEEKAAELHAFDQKLYKAQVDMNESMSQVLKHLGVPFFGTHAALILPDHDGREDEEGKVMDTQGERPKWSPRITGKELLELKKRMVAYLEDMYKS
ncbi:hypothetical protein E4T49_03489 [Aureobasidium sp. EXF-10728]|nr:hypothetical protein E4T49_03489 [Aureobasidium sp. EXF-10728]